MRRLLSTVLVAAGLAIPATAATASGTQPDDGSGASAGSGYIVRLEEGVDATEHLAELLATGSDVDVDHVFEDVYDGFAGTLDDDALGRLAEDPRVLSIEEDVPIRAAMQDQDPGSVGALSTAPWNLDRLDQRGLPLSGTYSPSGSGSGVTVYVVDTGVRGDHAELAGRVHPGYSAVADGRGTGDCNGHGTHVAGTAAGATYGVARSATVRSVRVLDCAGNGAGSQLVAGLNWIVSHHPAGQPAVANLSLGGTTSSAIDAAVQAVLDDGVTVVVAAGNEGAPACERSPARLPGALTVAATSSNDWSPNWSNWGSCLDLFAPGVSIRSAAPSSTTATVQMSGTSMAAPHVAGAAAVVLGARPDLAPSGVASRLNGDATPNLVTNAGTGSPNRLLHTPPMDAVPLRRPPGSPRSLVASSGDRRAALQWVAPLDPGNPSLSGYQVRCRPAVDTLTTRKVKTPATAVTVGRLTNGVAYRCAARARNELGWGAWSPKVTVRPAA